MKKLLLGAVLVFVICISGGFIVQESKSKKEPVKTETTKNVNVCPKANANAQAKPCCSQQSTCPKNCTSQQSTCPKNCTSQQSTCPKSCDKPCCPVNKVIAEKKTESKKK